MSQASVNDENDEKVVAIWVVPARAGFVTINDAVYEVHFVEIHPELIKWECKVFENVRVYFLIGDNGLTFWTACGESPWFILGDKRIISNLSSFVTATTTGAEIDIYPSVLLVAHLDKPYSARMLVNYMDRSQMRKSSTGATSPSSRTALILGNLREPLFSKMLKDARKYLGSDKPLKVLMQCFDKYKATVGNLEPTNI